MLNIKKIKVTLLNKQLLKQFGSVVSAFSIIFSLVVIFADIPDKIKPQLGYGLVILLILGYITMWSWANKILCRKIRINNSTVEVKTGDIFSEPGLKAIAFNEYFDTQVDEVVIASSTLNGKFINQKVSDINELNTLIEDDIYQIYCVLDKRKLRTGD